MRLEAWPPRTAGRPHSRAHPGAPRNHTRPPALRPHSGTPALAASPRRTKRTRRSSSRRRGRRRSYLHPAPAQASGGACSACTRVTVAVCAPYLPCTHAACGHAVPGSRVWIGDKHLTRLPQRSLQCGGACVTVWPAPSPDSDAYVRAAVRRSLGGMNCWCTGEAPGLLAWNAVGRGRAGTPQSRLHMWSVKCALRRTITVFSVGAGGCILQGDINGPDKRGGQICPAGCSAHRMREPRPTMRRRSLRLVEVAGARRTARQGSGHWALGRTQNAERKTEPSSAASTNVGRRQKGPSACPRDDHARPGEARRQNARSPLDLSPVVQAGRERTRGPLLTPTRIGSEGEQNTKPRPREPGRTWRRPHLPSASRITLRYDVM